MEDRVVTGYGLQLAEFARRIRGSTAARVVDGVFGERFVTIADMLKDINASPSSDIYASPTDQYLLNIVRELALKGEIVTVPKGFKPTLMKHQESAFSRDTLDVHTVPFFGNEIGKPLDIYYDRGPKAIAHDAGLAPDRLLTYADNDFVVFLANLFDKGPGGLPDNIEAAQKFPEVGQTIQLLKGVMSAFGFQDLDLTMTREGDNFRLQMTYKGDTFDFCTPITRKTDDKYFAGNNEKNAAIQLLLVELRANVKNKPLVAKLIREIETYLICKELGDLLILLMATIYAICHPEKPLTGFSVDGVFCARLLEYSVGLGNVSVVRQITKDDGAYRVVHYSNKHIDPGDVERREFDNYRKSCAAHNLAIMKKINTHIIGPDSVRYGSESKDLTDDLRGIFVEIFDILTKANEKMDTLTTRKEVTEYKAIDFFTPKGIIAKGVKHLFVKGTATDLEARFREIVGSADLIARIQKSRRPFRGGMIVPGGNMVMDLKDLFVPKDRKEKRRREPEAEAEHTDTKRMQTDLMDVLTNIETYIHMELDADSKARFDSIKEAIANLTVEEEVPQDPTTLVRQFVSSLLDDTEYIDQFMNMLEPYFNYFKIAIGPGGQSFYQEVLTALKAKDPSYTLMNLPELTLDEFQTLLGPRLENLDRVGKVSPPGGEMGGGARRTHRRKRMRKGLKTRKAH